MAASSPIESRKTPPGADGMPLRIRAISASSPGTGPRPCAPGAVYVMPLANFATARSDLHGCGFANIKFVTICKKDVPGIRPRGAGAGPIWQCHASPGSTHGQLVLNQPFAQVDPVPQKRYKIEVDGPEPGSLNSVRFGPRLAVQTSRRSSRPQKNAAAVT